MDMLSDLHCSFLRSSRSTGCYRNEAGEPDHGALFFLAFSGQWVTLAGDAGILRRFFMLSTITIQKVKKILICLIVVVAVGAAVNLFAAPDAALPGAAAAPVKAVKAAAPESAARGWIFISAALCIGFSSLAAGWAVSTVGAAAMGAISEKPELAGRALIFVGLAEGIAIYGLIVAIMLLGKA